MDISDKNFKPCPCGYQVCQFCYNNIRQNPELNGKCPACRRTYDDESVEYKVVSQEEWKYEHSKQTRRDRERKQKEKEKKEHEQANRKHLAGMRVIQKNLVYVVGLNPSVASDELHTILRSDKYFGQYGKIQKIVINKRTPPAGVPQSHNQNLGFGVYVTFNKKEEATKCINAIDGTYIDGRPLKAAYGTTKYCSSYLRGQNCPNPNCMFLHEPGEEADSYTRQDLSTRQGLKMNGDPNSTQHQGLSQSQQQNGFKSSSQFSNPRYSNNSQYYNHHNGSSSSIHHRDQDENNYSYSNSNNNNNSNNGNHTPQPSHTQPILGSAPLPATASWASNSIPKTSNVSSPTNATSVLANSSAFPTLAESTTLQQQQQHHQQQQTRKQKASNNNSNNNNQGDEFSYEQAAVSFIDETLNFLNSLPRFNYQIKSNVIDEELDSFPPLFAYSNIKVDNTPGSFNLKLVESLISKPVTKSISPQLQQLALQQQQQAQIQQNQQLAQVQAQVQAQQTQAQLTPSQQAPQLNDFTQAYTQQQQQQRPQSQSQNPQQFYSPQATAAGLLQQQQQFGNQDQAQLLQEQLRQQQQQQILLNQLKNERNFSATPPPPGLYQNSGAPNSATESQQSNQVGGTASELLFHLMNGKKIST
ncbi:putative negative regulator of transcription [Wickerhamomyces ciferrii]|uniref:Negative regulator of transcription n=1 Tax=Wickerhamomyces ciferrii (strain ATCC 14091 / BCRC 22168 / CBS 111 / JCM 3599 / NBRC 0793 / NRRL Y-1031 F-60-10) TaxID=1206466 RepID=K0KQD1_WICCF|nr:putative negative regulator of transcription [Wickerhamomyces ciferrii]CCH44357.1 putative negative regulator of transcription [Wickerhamomyces ciferrii]